MKNKTTTTVTGTPSGPHKKSKGKRGRKKEKTQISVRIDKAVMDLAYDHIGASKERITDFIERGLILAMQEKFRLPPICSQVRFIASHVSREENRGAAAYYAMRHLGDVVDEPEWPLVFLRNTALEALNIFERHCRPEIFQHLLETYGYPAEESEEQPTA